MKRKREEEPLTPSLSSKKFKQTIVKTEESKLHISQTAPASLSPASSTSPSRRCSASPSGTDAQEATDATSVDEDTIVVQSPPISPASRFRRSRGTKPPAPLEQARAGEPILVGDSTSAQHPAVQDDATSILSDLKSEAFVGLEESAAMAITPKAPSAKKSEKKRGRKSERPTIDRDHAPPVRVPGDYVLTPALLAEPYSHWINCKICEESFVQKDSYYTRSSCPRCERHSKLYGYMWPKTDKEDSDDEEERVLDHRTVHRFIRPDEERSIRKRNRDSTGSRAVTREISEAVKETKQKEVEEEDGEEGKTRGRKRARKARATM
jgi:histone-lysine N-methyltransferase SUV420H